MQDAAGRLFSALRSGLLRNVAEGYYTREGTANEWRVDSGEWTVGSGQWGSGEWGVGEWGVDGGGIFWGGRFVLHLR